MEENENAVRRIMPHDYDAERRLVATIVQDVSVISEINGKLEKDDFYNPQMGILYETIVELYDEGKSLDEVIISERLRKKGVPEEISNLSYLGEMLSELQFSTKAADYASIILEKSSLRKLIRLMGAVAEEAYADREKVDRILETAEDRIFKLVQDRNGSHDVATMQETVVDVLSQIEEAARNKGKINGLPTGFIDLDNKLTGLHGGELILVAARPAIGKTAFVLNIAHHVAVREKTPVAIFSLEMSADSLTQRVLAMDSHVDAQKLKTGDLDDDDWDKLIESSEIIAKAPIYIDDNSGINISEMRSKCIKLKQTKDIGLIIIDYLQLMNSTGPVESRQNFIASVSRALKGLARELNIPVIALSQLNRAVDSRPDHKPVLADLRESGSIEQDADVVMFIYRDDYYNKESERPGIAEIIVAKQRNGSTGPIDLAWIGKYTQFANLEK